jgi:hypothetical protein
VGQIYPSKIDALVAALMLCAPILTLLAVLRNGLAGTALVSVTLLLCLLIGLAVWFMLSTRYELDGRALIVRCGPFTWEFAYAEILSVERTNDARSGPALSLDRLRVTCADREILISPRDQAQFLRELHQRAPRARIDR